MVFHFFLFFGLVCFQGLKDIAACKIEVGHIIQIQANQRVPADVIFLRTTDVAGSCFIRTDQLDGETDWKLRSVEEGAFPLLSSFSRSFLRSSRVAPFYLVTDTSVHAFT